MAAQPSQRLFYHLSVPYPSGGASGGACEVGMPLVCLLHHADASALLARDAALPPPPPPLTIPPHAGAAAAASRGALPVASRPRGSAVLSDVLAILRRHGGGILPGMSADGRLLVGADAGGAGGGGGGSSAEQQQQPQHNQPTYHGEFTSVRFTLRPGEEEGNYAVLLPGGWGGGGAGGGGGGTAAAHHPFHPPRFTSLPVSRLSLHAYVKDKEAEAARRRAADVAAGVARLPFAPVPSASAAAAAAASAAVAGLPAAAPPASEGAADATAPPPLLPPPAKRRKPGPAAAAATAAMIAEAEVAGYRDAAEAQLRAAGAL